MSSQTIDRIRFVTRHFRELQGLRFLVPLGLIILSVGGTTYFDNPPWVALRVGFFLTGTLLMLGAGRYYRDRFGEVEPEPPYEPGELHSLAVYSPSGPVSRLRGFQVLTPRARFLLITLGLAFAIFFVLQAIAPTIQVEEDQSLVQPPWATLDYVFMADEPWTRGIGAIIGRSPVSSSTEKAVAGQLLYALCGAWLLGTWLWRGRRGSQGYHLALGVLLLGLSACGTFLGYFVWEDRELPVRIINLLLPAVAHLWTALVLCGSSLILAGLLDHQQLARALGRRSMMKEIPEEAS
jgi:hypothetical protein